MQNPFRNALQTFNLLPDDRKDEFWDSFAVDVNDLSHNGNPLEHTAATTEEEALSYIGVFDGVPDLASRYRVESWLKTLAEAFDLIGPKFESQPAPYSTMFGGEEGEGIYLEFPDPTYDHYFVLVVNWDEDDETVFTVSSSPVKIISEVRTNA